jgi:CRP-like cAMP-binding protein
MDGETNPGPKRMSSTDPFAVSPDLAALLNTAVLRLAPEIRTSLVRADRRVVKYEKGRRYLVTTVAQWQWLQEFQGGRTAKEVLLGLISQQRCPPLRDFYELVVKAVRDGILQTEGQAVPPPRPPAKWRLRLPGRWVRWPAMVLMAVAVTVVGLHRVQPPREIEWMMLGWIAACAASSLGYALAACVARAGGAEIYRPRFAWLTPAPRFRADLDDAGMGGRATEIDTAVARLAPPVILTGVAAEWCPPLVLPLLCGVFLHLSPLWPSPLVAWLRALYSDPWVATTYDSVFVRDQLLRAARRIWRPFEDRKFILACAAAAAAWLALLFGTGCVLWQVHASDLLRRFRAAGGWHWAELAALGVIAALIAGTVAVVVWIVGHHLVGWWRERVERRRRPRTALMSPAAMADWLGRTVLFRDLPRDDLLTLAAVMKPEEHRARSFVVREGEPGNRLYVVVSGRLEVRRDYARGRSEPVARLSEGDVFGEIALLEGGVRTRSVRCRSASVLLALDKADFEQIVMTRVSREAVTDAVQKVGFLQHTAWARGWSYSSLTAFARRSTLREYREGDVLIEEGTPNLWFFLVHRGELSVREGTREVRRLTTGDPFGELSVLKGGLATANVIVRSRTASCLLMENRDFLSFVTGDFAVGLRLEELGARRRGWPRFSADV